MRAAVSMLGSISSQNRGVMKIEATSSLFEISKRNKSWIICFSVRALSATLFSRFYLQQQIKTAHLFVVDILYENVNVAYETQTVQSTK